MADRRTVDREVKFVVSALCWQRRAQASCCLGQPTSLLLTPHCYFIAIHLIVIWGPGWTKHPGLHRGWPWAPEEWGLGCLQLAEHGERALACPPWAESPCIDSRSLLAATPYELQVPVTAFQTMARAISAPDTTASSISPTWNGISRWSLLPC